MKYIAAFVLITGTFVSQALAHCQIPCGVYTDEMRFTMLEEDFQTIEKAMNQINTLSDEKAPDLAKVTRWTMAKEQHAGNVQKIVTEYFMTQRIKLDAENYEAKIRTLHAMLISAMKCKQGTDVANAAKLRETIHAFDIAYFGAEEAAHVREHHHGDHR